MRFVLGRRLRSLRLVEAGLVVARRGTVRGVQVAVLRRALRAHILRVQLHVEGDRGHVVLAGLRTVILLRFTHDFQLELGQFVHRLSVD